jgi:hypothetical protein
MGYGFSALAVVAALCLMGASGYMNFLFWQTQGRSQQESEILSSVSVAFDVLKCLLPVFIAKAWALRKRVYAAGGSIFLVFFFCFSFVSALGFAAGNRGFVSGGREALGLRLEAASSEQSSAKLRLKDLNRQRPASVVEAEIKMLQQDKFWKGSQNCANPSGGEARDFCKTYLGRRAELAAAIEAERLTKRVGELNLEIETLKGRGAGEDRDPQARMLAVLSGLAPDMAQKVLIVGFALLVELGAAFGLFLATGHGFGESGSGKDGRKGRKAGEPGGMGELLPPQRAAVVPLRFKRIEGGGLIVDDGARKKSR